MREFLSTLISLFFLHFCASEGLSKSVILLKIKSAITPSSTTLIQKSIDYAEKEKAEVFILQLNTPGGLLESTRDIVQKFFESSVPIVVWVGPSGARAGSAGVFITLSAHISAMAPGTNIGAAHPVGLGGTADTSIMNEKIVNDAAAFIRTIAKKRNRNTDWAEKSVRESISSTETEVLEMGVIDFIAPDIDSLLRAIHGRIVDLNGITKKIDTKNTILKEYEISWRDKFLDFITNPNIAYILLIIGIYGIFFELYNPGSVLPGVIGAISLVLAIYSLQMLPINIAGIALIILSIIFFILEIKIVSYGFLTIAGLVSLFLGSIFLIDSPNDFMKISLSLILTVVIVTFLFFTFVITLGIKAQFKSKKLGYDELIGLNGTVIEGISPLKKGKVKIMGEIWNAISNQVIEEGTTVVITKADSFTLFVEPK